MVAAHKEFPMPKDEEMYLPVLVGAVNNYVDGISYQRDDQGENISKKNGSYSELTAVYWAWKNLLDVDAVGLVHYRRHFIAHGTSSLENVLTQQAASELLQHWDVLLPKKRHYFIETNYSHYIHAHHREPLDVTRKVIEDSFPEYIQAFDTVMSRRSAHMFNMFVMNRKRFSQYASFLFTVLSSVERRVNLDGYSKQELRVFGYLSELLMDVWVEANHIEYKELRWGQIGPKKTFKKAYNFLKRKFEFGEKVTHF